MCQVVKQVWRYENCFAADFWAFEVEKKNQCYVRMCESARVLQKSMIHVLQQTEAGREWCWLLMRGGREIICSVYRFSYRYKEVKWSWDTYLFQIHSCPLTRFSNLLIHPSPAKKNTEYYFILTTPEKEVPLICLFKCNQKYYKIFCLIVT